MSNVKIICKTIFLERMCPFTRLIIGECYIYNKKERKKEMLRYFSRARLFGNKFGLSIDYNRDTYQANP